MKTGETAKHHQIFDGYKKGSYSGDSGSRLDQSAALI